MNLWTLSLNSLRHYRRTQFGVWLGLMIGAMVLTGSLIVGDSVNCRLHNAVMRVQEIFDLLWEHVLAPRDDHVVGPPSDEQLAARVEEPDISDAQQPID